MKPIHKKNNWQLLFASFVFTVPFAALSNDTMASENPKTDNNSVIAKEAPKVEDVSKKPARNFSKAKKPLNSNGSNNSAFRQNPNRYVFHFLAWIDDPYIAYQVLPNPYTGKFHTVPVVRYNRILVRVYLDRVTNTYGYFDRFGNPVPYLQNRYRNRCFPF